MNIPIETLVGWGGTLVIIGGAFSTVTSKNNRNAEEIKDLWRWKESHQKDVGEVRDKFQNQLSELKGASLVVNEQFRQIMAMFEEIKQRLSILESNKNGGGHQ